MSKEFSRTQRVSQQLQKELALILQREVRDSRIGMVTISDVEVSRDLAYAKVFVTFLCIGEQTPESCLAALKEHEVPIRMALGKRIRHRLTPEVRFTYDNTLVEGMRMSNLVSEVLNDDKRKQEAAGRTDETQSKGEE
ncbi:30S ribosome binding factor [Vibrio chagasii]|jgi:ribosome-binding factor A|uniref:Ribosome-binding factor A n=1 Tax=Vibrio chagasii TaxID=170679 RepID=A0A2S7VIC2_9VIBR|nr:MULTISPECIES: 30S ribosome-binding factor RbfA [Vibrio]EDK29315.1 ribosome-binding factor A [Vibrionales bacterium SWAT-3]MDE9379348.1 30S ribosome-binding factor RbfA [Vibrio alginolyticus]MEC7942200.1 30S ribosome-binding factor RbfA [Pseudomonadota bacterium]EGU44167.1 ribosome-binding factor A [Vibrio splendidus ATCC 33789]KAB0480956.1 30S ribosome-binding factor RbfA [Vibrio chagasii]|tara:strand:+ start:63 stop:476 length:414 start_codon:yes stop_codon:yes gene_type:complete